ncbi:MAG: GNAT family N-acetyltransferase [Sarcina sp.]
MINIREVCKNDWNEIARIYKQGIDSKKATFQDTVPSYEVWDSKYLDGFKVIFQENEKILGFAALGKVSERQVYSGVVVLTIYVDKESRGKGVATKLINYLIELSEEEGFFIIKR